MQRMNWMMAGYILLMSRMDLPDTQEARAATATTQSKHVRKGAKLRYGIRFFSWMQCSGFAFVGAQWFWTHIYGNVLVHFPASLCQLGMGKFQCSSRRDLSLECRPFKSSQKIHRDSLFHRSQALLTYLAVEKKACNFNLRTQNFLVKKLWGSGKNWRKIVVRL